MTDAGGKRSLSQGRERRVKVDVDLGLEQRERKREGAYSPRVSESGGNSREQAEDSFCSIW